MWALEGAVLHPDDPALRLPVRIADCICTGLRKHSGRIRYRDGVLQTVCPVGRPPSPLRWSSKGYDLIYAGGAHARNSVPQISCRCVPPAGRTLHHVEDVQIRDPVGGQSRRRCDERRSPRWRCRRRGLRRWRRRRDDRRSVGPKPPLATPSRKSSCPRWAREQTIAVHHRTVERRMTQVERQQNRRVTDAGWTLIEESTNNVSRSRRSRTAHHGSVRRGESHPVSQYRGR